jgi:hypothetical protein
MREVSASGSSHGVRKTPLSIGFAIENGAPARSRYNMLEARSAACQALQGCPE